MLVLEKKLNNFRFKISLQKVLKKSPKKKTTSPIWNHFTELLVEEKADGNSNHEDGNDSIMDRDDGDNTMDLEEEDS